MLPFVLLSCAFVEASHHIATLFTNMTLPLPLLRVRYHPQSKYLSVTLLILCIVLYIIVFGLELETKKKSVGEEFVWPSCYWIRVILGIAYTELAIFSQDTDLKFIWQCIYDCLLAHGI